MLTYLILSPKYYENVDSNSMYKISAKLNKVYQSLKIRHKKLDFAAFRYDNCSIPTTHEYCMLLRFIEFCYNTNTIPILNLSNYKLEVFVLLWLHGFYMGIHFKEMDMPMLKNNICEALTQSLYATTRNMTLQNSLLSIYDKMLNLSPFAAKKLERLILDKSYLEEFITPLQLAINICNKTMCFESICNKFTSNLSQRFPIFVSTHNIHDLSEMLSYGINYATISPIFYDKGNKALGLKYLQNLPDNLKSIAFALGGINSDYHIRQIAECGLCGFASISYFLNICD